MAHGAPVDTPGGKRRLVIREDTLLYLKERLCQISP